MVLASDLIPWATSFLSKPMHFLRGTELASFTPKGTELASVLLPDEEVDILAWLAHI